MKNRWLLLVAILLYFPFCGNSCQHEVDSALSPNLKSVNIAAHFSGHPLPGEVGTLTVDGQTALTFTISSGGVGYEVNQGNHTIQVTSEKATGTWTHTFNVTSNYDMECQCNLAKVTVNTDFATLVANNINGVNVTIGGVKYSSTPIEPGGSATYDVTPGKNISAVCSDQNGRTIRAFTLTSLGYGSSLSLTVDK